MLKNRIMDDPKIMTRLKESLKETMTPAESKRLMDAYSLSEDRNSIQQYDGLLRLGSDLRFYFPILHIQKGWNGKRERSCLRYHFHQVRALHFMGSRTLLTSYPREILSRAGFKTTHPMNSMLFTCSRTSLLHSHQDIKRSLEGWQDFGYFSHMEGDGKGQVKIR